MPIGTRTKPCLLIIALTVFIDIAVYTRPIQASPNLQTAQSSLFLPLISNNPSTETPQMGWQLNLQEQQLATLFVNDPEQHRQNPTRQDILSHVARARAEDMAERNYFSHTDPDGHEANFLVEQADYQLPDYYPNNGNNIESIGLNFTTAAAAWQAWKDSPGHRVHVLGEDPFYAEQTDYGFGYAERADRRYWVVITATH
ncbi:MAG: CAP domain-containing protein [Chloroflexi bacterium]|nr:CAP domain-containing protein [Chloroflexota bacterium]